MLILINTITQTDGIGKSNFGTCMNIVEHGTKRTNTSFGNNMWKQTLQMHPSDFFANTISRFNNYTRTQRPIE